MEVVTASARFGEAVTRPENLLKIHTEAKKWHYYTWPEVEVARLYPIINVKLHVGGMVDTRWFLRKPDAIAYVVQLRLEHADVRGVEEALEKLSS